MKAVRIHRQAHRAAGAAPLEAGVEKHPVEAFPLGRELCASSSNRNFKGRQGSPSGRTLLMSPAMVAAAAIEGAVVDVREILK